MMLTGKRLLVIEDDINLRQSLKIQFSREGATVYTANDGREGLRLFQQNTPDLVILDIQLPYMDGWDTSAQMRSLSNTPIIMLTSMGQESAMLRGLKLGADDYITKPFSRDVLLARIEAVLRRTAPKPNRAQPTVYRDSYLEIDLEKHLVKVQDKPIKLSATEFKLLTFLLKNAGQTLSYQAILSNVWGLDSQSNSEYVHVYMSRLRRSIEADPQNPRYLFTDHGMGYGFVTYNAEECP